MEAYVLWFILGLVLSIMEIFTAGFFIIWFGVAALITAVLAYFYHSPLVELITFITSAIVLLFLTKPFVNKVNNTSSTASNVDALIGMRGIVVTEIDNIQGKGLVKVNGETWSSRSEEGSNIKAQTEVIVYKVEGAKLLVHVIK